MKSLAAAVVHILTPALHLDARRVLWLPDERALVAADLHLGYAWAHRHAGQLLPIAQPDDTIDRLLALIAEYDPAQLVLLGDIVHRAVPVRAIEDQLAALCERLGSLPVRWIMGNHDRSLDRLLIKCGLNGIRLEPNLRLGPHLLTHGDEIDQNSAAATLAALDPNGWLLMGHEHPGIHVGDGITTSLKCPCFLAGQPILILPAFSGWAAHTNIRTAQFQSAYARAGTFTRAYAILAGRILPISLCG